MSVWLSLFQFNYYKWQPNMMRVLTTIFFKDYFNNSILVFHNLTLFLFYGLVEKCFVNCNVLLETPELKFSFIVRRNVNVFIWNWNFCVNFVRSSNNVYKLFHKLVS